MKYFRFFSDVLLAITLRCYLNQLLSLLNPTCTYLNFNDCFVSFPFFFPLQIYIIHKEENFTTKAHTTIHVYVHTSDEAELYFTRAELRKAVVDFTLKFFLYTPDICVQILLLILLNLARKNIFLETRRIPRTIALHR